MNASLVSVDIENPSFTPPDELKSHWNFVRSDAIQFLESNTTKFDIVFIDDWHEGNHVKKEIDLVDKFSDKSTIILLHDLMYGWKNPNYTNIDSGAQIDWGTPGEFDNGGPCRAVFSLDKNRWEWATLPFCNGLTLLRKIQ
jgi:hypothetical protein